MLSGPLPPRIGGGSAAQSAEERGYSAALDQLLRQSALILAPLGLLAVALGWLVAGRLLRPGHPRAKPTLLLYRSGRTTLRSSGRESLPGGAECR